MATMQRGSRGTRGVARAPEMSPQLKWGMVAGGCLVAMMVAWMVLSVASAPAQPKHVMKISTAVAAQPAPSSVPGEASPGAVPGPVSTPTESTADSGLPAPAVQPTPSPKAQGAAKKSPPAPSGLPSPLAGGVKRQAASHDVGSFPPPPVTAPEPAPAVSPVDVPPPTITSGTATRTEPAAPPSVAPTSSPQAPAPTVPVALQMSGQDYEEHALVKGEDVQVGLNSALLGVARVEWEGSVCRPWLFVYNATNREQRVALSPRLRDSSGREYEAMGGGALGQVVPLARGHVLYLWPSFRVPAERAGGNLQVSLILQGYGRLHVPAREQMTNLGLWEDLHPAARERFADAFGSSARFKWWGSPR